MGCDIHMYLEHTKKENNRPEKYWSSFGGRLNPGRNYYLFGFLTNGRVRYEPTCDGLIDVKGIPDGDISYHTNGDLYMYISDDGKGDNETTMEKALKWNKEYGCKLKYGHDGVTPVFVECPDWHSKTWLTMTEYEMILNKAIECDPKDGWDYIGFEYQVVLDLMKSLESHGRETRLVIWFDN